jgi:hypothetical protein
MAGELGVGTKIVTRAGPDITVASTRMISRGTGWVVYNFEVEGDHTYFVGGVGGGVWVHNPDCGIGDLTKAEIDQIQKLTNQAGRPIHVVGSAARGARKATSDIDYVIPPSSADYWKDLWHKLPGMDFRHGPIDGVPNPFIGPHIPFEPR